MIYSTRLRAGKGTKPLVNRDCLKIQPDGSRTLKWYCQRQMPLKDGEYRKPTITVRLNPKGSEIMWNAGNGSPRPNWLCVVEALSYFLEKLEEEAVSADIATDVQVHQEKRAISAIHQGKRYYLGRRGKYLVGWEGDEASRRTMYRVPLPVLRAVIDDLERVLQD